MSCISYAFAWSTYLSSLSCSGGAGCVCVFDSHARVNILVWPLAGLVTESNSFKWSAFSLGLVKRVSNNSVRRYWRILSAKYQYMRHHEPWDLCLLQPRLLACPVEHIPCWASSWEMCCLTGSGSQLHTGHPWEHHTWNLEQTFSSMFSTWPPHFGWCSEQSGCF